ncbi:glycosyltransferase family 9 protein, partial [bacterium]|nr:glycosyltransferase family 9 protein [bacterium]MBU1614611.1 glycosyltransferase family 9 protein [bacterium]
MKELIPALREIHQKGQRKERLTFEEMILLLFEGVINLGWPDERINLRFKPASIHGPINKILLIQLSSIGDVIYVTPVIPGLKEKFPKANLTFLVEETAKDIVTDNPGIDEVLLFPERRLLKEIQEGNYQKVIREIGLFAKKLRESQFDLAINLHTSPRSAGFTYLSGAKNISGLTLDESGLPFTCGSPWMFYKYFVGCNPVMAGLNPLNLVELSIKMAEVNPGVRETKVFIPPATEEKISQILSSFGVKEDDLLVGLNPGSNFACRRWIEEEFACLADLLDREYRAKIIIFGGPGDVELAKRIAQPMQARPINLAGKTNLKELAALISRCDHLITGDTGPMHLAGAVKTPTIVVAGPTRDGPYGCENHLLLQANLPCVGCGPTSKCEKKDCMKAIKAGDVLAALRYQRG